MNRALKIGAIVIVLGAFLFAGVTAARADGPPIGSVTVEKYCIAHHDGTIYLHFEFDALASETHIRTYVQNDGGAWGENDLTLDAGAYGSEDAAIAPQGGYSLGYSYSGTASSASQTGVGGSQSPTGYALLEIDYGSTHYSETWKYDCTENPAPYTGINLLPDSVTAPYFSVAAADGATPCGVFDVNGWGRKYVGMADFPACTAPVTVMCLNGDGEWTADNVSDIVLQGDYEVDFTSSQHGICALFPSS